MASDDARARQSEWVAVQHAADPAEPVRTRHVSGWAPKPTLDTSLVLDEDREPEKLSDTGEPTLVTPGEVIESLREASRLEAASASLPTVEHYSPYFFRSEAIETRDEDDTTIFVLHEDKDLRSAWIYRALPLAGAVALASLLALRGHPSREPVTPRKPVSAKVSQPPLVRPAPSPVVMQLQPKAAPAAESVTNAPAEEDAAEQAQLVLDTRRKWMRALERGNARLSAGEYDSAVFSFERAIEYDPQDPRAYAGLAEAQVERGKWTEAARAYREAIALSPNDPALRVGLDRVYEQAGRDETATQAYDQAIEPELGGTE